MKYAKTIFLFVLLIFALCISVRGQTYVKVLVSQPEALGVSLPDPDYDASDSVVIVGDDLQINGGILPYSMEWTDSHGLITTDSSFIAKLDSTAVYTLTVTDARGCYEEHSVTVSVVNSINNPLERRIRVYPVPATSFLQVDLPAEMRQTHLTLVNYDGTIIWQKQVTGNCRIPLYYAPGIYFLKMKSGSFEAVRKIIIR